jgi:hypothetical protein
MSLTNLQTQLASKWYLRLFVSLFAMLFVKTVFHFIFHRQETFSTILQDSLIIGFMIFLIDSIGRVIRKNRSKSA